MSIFGFKARGADRDRETDAQRFETLCRTIDDLSRQVASERDGLTKRLEKVRTDAAFTLQALEDDPESGLSARVDELMGSLQQCERRLDKLQAHFGFLAELREHSQEYLVVGEPAAED